ncbi:MAG: VLRF1 family aeRF1-type release factor [bacterium]|nr:VLRF1 family aeRF1-type release factor [bacterium]
MINLDDVKGLLEREDNAVLSLYLQVDPALQENQAATPAWRSWLNTALRDTPANIPEAQRTLWNNIHERLMAYLNSDDADAPFRPRGKGLALFYGEGFEQIYDLPVPLEGNAIHFGTPVVAPLLWAIDEYEPYLLVLVDSEEARFVDVYLGQLEQRETIADDRNEYDHVQRTAFSSRPTPGGFGSDQGNEEDKFEDMIDELIARFHREVAQRTRDLMARLDADRLIIGGPEKSAHAVKSYLHDEVANKLVTVINAPLREAMPDLMARITPIAQEYERQKEMELVQQVIDFAKSGGRGALGRKAVQDALMMQQVETLVIPWPLQDDDDFLRELPERALRTSMNIELVSGEAGERLRQEGGLGARLYYAIKPA